MAPVSGREPAAQQATQLAAQAERRERMLDATVALAARGGYDAVQMRAVAERSGVALGTVYRYFPSKNHLLVVATLQMFEQFAEQFDVEHTPGSSPRERVMWVLHGALAQLEREPRLYDALVRASMFADSSSAAELDRLGKVITGMYARAAGIETITEELENAVRIMQATGQVDVSDLLPQVRVPTLVLHGRNDAAIPFDEGRRLAAGIPGARFVALETRNHLVLEHEPAWKRLLEEVTAFLKS